MKYLINCNLTEKSIENLNYFQSQNIKSFKNLKSKQNFSIPIISLDYEHYAKIKNSIFKNFSKIQTFRVNIATIKHDLNKNIYLLIEPKGFLSTIQRLLEEDLISNDIKNYEKLNKWNYFYVDYMSFNKLNIDLNDILFPNYIKINSLNILKYNHKKNNLVDSIQFKNI